MGPGGRQRVEGQTPPSRCFQCTPFHLSSCSNSISNSKVFVEFCMVMILAFQCCPLDRHLSFTFCVLSHLTTFLSMFFDFKLPMSSSYPCVNQGFHFFISLFFYCHSLRERHKHWDSATLKLEVMCYLSSEHLPFQVPFKVLRILLLLLNIIFTSSCVGKIHQIACFLTQGLTQRIKRARCL